MKAHSTPSVPSARAVAVASDLRMLPVFAGWNRTAYLLGIGGWLVTLAYFWIW